VNPWPFILGAYGLTLAGSLSLAWSSLRAMRRAETDAESLAR
jgi:hypothetical protein